MPASPTIEAIATAVKSAIEAVSGSGVVHDRPRHTFEPDEFIALFKDTADNKLRTWIIRVTESPDEEDPAGFLFLVRRRVQVEGWFGGMVDTPETWTAHRTLVDNVKSGLTGNPAVFGTAPLATPRDITVSPIDESQFGDVVVHHVIMEFQVESQETKTT